MKKIIFSLMLLAALFTSCNMLSNLSGYDTAKLNITLYANDTEVEGGFTFTATEEWSTFVEYKGEESGWINIDPANGNAGKVTLNIAVDENTSGESRSAVVHIVCGASNLNVNLVQKATENNGGENGDGESEENEKDEPAQRLELETISRIIIDMEESGRNVCYTYSFMRDNLDGTSPITRVRIDGLPREDGAATVYDGSIEYRLNYSPDEVNIDLYGNDYYYCSYQATVNGDYIDQVSYSETIELCSNLNNTQSEIYQGVENHTYYFNRKPGANHLTNTRYVCETLIDGHEEMNKYEEREYHLKWEDAEVYSSNYFKNDYNLTEVAWLRDGWEENYEYIGYNTDLNIGNIIPKTYPILGTFVDLNYLITTFWNEGTLEAYGHCNGIIGLLCLAGTPSYNLISDLSARYGEWQTNPVHVEYTLNNKEQVESFTMSSNDSYANVRIEYIEL